VDNWLLVGALMKYGLHCEGRVPSECFIVAHFFIQVYSLRPIFLCIKH
jgi:hypothetical protein